MRGKYKVWCKDKNEWEKDECVMDQSGMIYHITHGSQGRRIIMPIRTSMHIAVFFTGLKDKNGKEIYEEDIVRWVDTEGTVYIKKVVYNVKSLSFQIGNISYNNLSVSGYFQTKLEVIGNGFKNPELLNPKQEEGE